MHSQSSAAQPSPAVARDESVLGEGRGTRELQADTADRPKNKELTAAHGPWHIHNQRGTEIHCQIYDGKSAQQSEIGDRTPMQSMVGTIVPEPSDGLSALMRDLDELTLDEAIEEYQLFVRAPRPGGAP